MIVVNEPYKNKNKNILTVPRFPHRNVIPPLHRPAMQVSLLPPHIIYLSATLLAGYESESKPESK